MTRFASTIWGIVASIICDLVIIVVMFFGF